MKSVSLLIMMGAVAACTSAGSSSEVDLQASCEALVAAETGTRPDSVSAVSTQIAPTGSVTTVSVEGATAPWLCRADAAGVVTGVEYSQEG